jgi:hypothetical protein
MFAMSEARAINISPLFRPTCEDDIYHLCGDAPIHDMPNHSGIDDAHHLRTIRASLARDYAVSATRLSTRHVKMHIVTRVC